MILESLRIMYEETRPILEANIPILFIGNSIQEYRLLTMLS